MYAQIIEKLLEEIDPDIRAVMLSTSKPDPGAKMGDGEQGYPNWHTLHHPVLDIIAWQKFRDGRRQRKLDNFQRDIGK